MIVYAAIIQIGGRIIGADVDDDDGWATAGNVLEATLIPIALSALFVIALATWLRWWPQIIHEPLAVQRWVRIVPIALLLPPIHVNQIHRNRPCGTSPSKAHLLSAAIRGQRWLGSVRLGSGWFCRAGARLGRGFVVFDSPAAACLEACCAPTNIARTAV